MIIVPPEEAGGGGGACCETNITLQQYLFLPVTQVVPRNIHLKPFYTNFPSKNLHNPYSHRLQRESYL